MSVKKRMVRQRLLYVLQNKLFTVFVFLFCYLYMVNKDEYNSLGLHQTVNVVQTVNKGFQTVSATHDAKPHCASVHVQNLKGRKPATLKRCTGNVCVILYVIAHSWLVLHGLGVKNMGLRGPVKLFTFTNIH